MSRHLFAACAQVADTIWENKKLFLLVFFCVFFVSYLVLAAVDFLPEPIKQPSEEVEQAVTLDTEVIEEPRIEAPALEPALPVSIHIRKLDKTITVLNPESRSIADLDTALLSGVVRHPDSAMLAQDGNLFILGHSSYLPVVTNKNFQAFNGIQNLLWGDIIEVSSGSHIHVFEVESVYKADANSLTVPIAGDERRLTLATCNSFGSVDDRFIVEAREIEVRPL